MIDLCGLRGVSRPSCRASRTPPCTGLTEKRPVTSLRSSGVTPVSMQIADTKAAKNHEAHFQIRGAPVRRATKRVALHRSQTRMRPQPALSPGLARSRTLCVSPALLAGGVMADVAELHADNPVLARQAEILGRPATTGSRMANAIRALAIDAVEAAEFRPSRPADGHGRRRHRAVDALPEIRRRRSALARPRPLRAVRRPRLDAALFAAAPDRPCRHGLDDIRHFRQLHSPAAGHPEFGEHPGIETTTGPLGQGIAHRRRHGAGRAACWRRASASSLVDHRTWVIASDGDLMEGDQPRGDRARRPSAAGEADGALGRQQHLDRWRYLAVAARRTAEALRRRRLGDQARSTGTIPPRSPRRCRSRCGRRSRH